MGFFDKFKKSKKENEVAKKVESKPAVKVAKLRKEELKKTEKRVDEKKVKPAVAPKKEIKGKTNLAYQILIRPIVTEKATYLGADNKYVFEINPKMNKIEVKKAIRSIYGVEPIKVNILRVLGKTVRYGRTSGQTKNWKKAIVTLKEGDKIEVYEGV